ncbi:MAG TPA: methyl-accepting chemotaxis protein, partial [Rhodopila sp.]|nr:methyl-accepting chemotaxis protein [Rhodopila sp.]
DRRLRIKRGAVVRASLAAFAYRLSSGIASGFAISLGALFAVIMAKLAADWVGLPSGPLNAASLAVIALVSAATIMIMRRMRNAFRTIEAQFAALARGDLTQQIEFVPITELQSITGLLRGLRARLAYAEEVRAQREREALTDRTAAVQEMAGKVEEAANEMAEQVASTTSAMANDASVMAEAAGTVSANAATAADAGADALASTQTVAAAAEELAASIREIANRVTMANGVTSGAVAEGDAAGQIIAKLRDEVDRIGAITSLIADIAGQTNLLALNATIESARAGDAGRGFAVVANEVKKLAGQTAKATEDISRQIAQIQRATDETVAAVSRMGTKLGEIDNVSVAIAAAVEEQSAATQEISRSVNKAAASVQTVSGAMAGMAALASETNRQIERLRADAAGLAGTVDASRRSLVRAVRTSVAEAERRMQ